jgi:hypothetical protein
MKPELLRMRNSICTPRQLVFGLAILLALACVMVATLPRPADACAAAPPEDGHVAIASEDALIVWDAHAGVEHFIRRADFSTQARDFGFIVPTPTRPELGEVDDAVFERLEELVKPQVIEQTERKLEVVWLLSCLLPTEYTSGPDQQTAAVEELHRQRVAGLDAVVLRADDVGALGDWLAKHGYPFTPALREWAAPYVKRGWVFTAFKLAAPDRIATELNTAAVRMSFTTDQPFYPYREPADQRRAPLPPMRRLRVFFVGEHRMRGELEGGGEWPGLADAALPLAADALSDALDASILPSHGWLSSFIDKSNPRPGEVDLHFFAADADEELRRKPIVKKVMRSIVVPPDLVIGGIILALVGGPRLWRRLARRRGRSS